MTVCSGSGVPSSKAAPGASSNDLSEAIRHLEAALTLLDRSRAPKEAAAYIAVALDALKETF